MGETPSDPHPGLTRTQPPPDAQPHIQVAPLPPEASSSSVQTIMLGLGALLLGVAAVTFVGVAITGLDPISQLMILLAVAALFLVVPPVVAARGLAATAETLAAVGLVLFSVASYPLWIGGMVTSVTGPVYVGLVAAATATVGFAHHRLTGLAVPSWVALLALQPVLPLLLSPHVTGNTGWALVFASVAAHNAGLAYLAGWRPLGIGGWLLHGAAVVVSLTAAVAGLFIAGTLSAGTPAALALLLAGAVGAAGGRATGRSPLAHLGAGVLTLAVIVAGARLAWLVLPGRALLPIAVIMAATAAAVQLLPADARHGPRLASGYALAAYGVVVAALSLRAGFATLVWPPWPAALPDYQQRLAEAVGPASWQLAATAAAATVGAGLVLPAEFRREVAVAGAALTALAIPASLGLQPGHGAWAMVVVAAGLAMTGLSAGTRRAVGSHIGAAGLVGLAATSASLTDPALTASVLGALAVTGLLVAGARPRHFPSQWMNEWAAGGAALAMPGAAATSAYAAGLGETQVLAAGFAAACGSLGYAALTQLRHRFIPIPVRYGAGLATVAVAAAALLSGAEPPDVAIAVLLLATALLVTASARIDAIRRADRLLDGADLAAAAVTASIVVTLARITSLALPVTGADGWLFTAASLLLAVTIGIRTLPGNLRRGPVLGVTLLGGLVAGIAGTAAAVGAVRTLALTGPVWQADLRQWSPEPGFADISWAAPVALGLLAVAAGMALPRPLRYHVTALLVVLATLGATTSFGLPWWAPAALSTLVGTIYAIGAVGLPPAATITALDRQFADWVFGPQAAWPRAGAAAVLATYAVGASLARPWASALVLAVVVLVGTLVATLAAGRRRTDPRLRVGGVAVTGVLLAVPGALAALAAHYGHTPIISVPAALGGSALGLAVIAGLHATLPVPPAATRSEPPLAPYLPYATIGTAIAATAIAFVTLTTLHPTGVYAAAAVLLAVVAELVRASEPLRWSGADATATMGGPVGSGIGGSFLGTHPTLIDGGLVRADRPAPGRLQPRPLISPPLGALLASVTATVLAMIAIAPALVAALIDPYQTLAAPWQGPPALLTSAAAVPATSVLAALLLTLAAALAAVGFGGAVTTQAVPLTAPGLAVTLLIAPAALGAPWPAATAAAMVVFTITMLGVALTPPPLPGRINRPLRAARLMVLVIGVAAGGAGLAGGAADPQLTWTTLGTTMAVGVGAALGGRTRLARLLGWAGAAIAAQAFALVSAYQLGLTRPQAAMLLLAVSAVALLLVPRLRHLRPPRSPQELATAEWLGGYLPLAGALVLAMDSILDLAGLLVGIGAVLGLAAVRVGRSHLERRILWWLAAASEVAALWIIMRLFEVGLLEAYTLPFAVFALLVGMLELRYRPELGSWLAYGPGLIAALGPSLVAVITTSSPDPVRQVWVILGGVAALLLGSRLGQRAPLIIGSVVTAVAALHLLSLAGPWLMLVPLGLLLLVLGANREKRRRDLERLRGAYSRMR